MPDELEDLKSKVAQACRILAMTGLVKEITGHVSARVPGTDEMVLRCRGEDEFGLPYTGPGAVRRMSFDGEGGDVDTAHTLPIELPIHGELLRARPEIGCVVHAHPPYTLLCGMAGIELKPVMGAYEPAAIRIAKELAIYPRSILISSRDLGQELLRCMERTNFAILRGHGIVVVGETVEEATINAIRLEHLSKVCWQLASQGLPLPEISAEDQAAFGGPTNPRVARGAEWVWRYYARLEESWTPSVVS
jgi:ribulose-5-phosphate 4-epimerase/fuculose-1-phosphate aldolase